MKQQMRQYVNTVFKWTEETMSPRGEDKVLLLNKNSVLREGRLEPTDDARQFAATLWHPLSMAAVLIQCINNV